jgi:hypothetical protein
LRLHLLDAPSSDLLTNLVSQRTEARTCFFTSQTEGLLAADCAYSIDDLVVPMHPLSDLTATIE